MNSALKKCIVMDLGKVLLRIIPNTALSSLPEEKHCSEFGMQASSLFCAFTCRHAYPQKLERIKLSGQYSSHFIYLKYYTITFKKSFALFHKYVFTNIVSYFNNNESPCLTQQYVFHIYLYCYLGNESILFNCQMNSNIQMPHFRRSFY